jgi:anthranilate phosphoribosyltransferase
MLQQIMERVLAQENLSQQEMAATIGQIVDEDCPPAQIAGLLVALRAKGETVDELAGAAEAFRARSVPVPLDDAPLLDTAGTGGDGAGTINLSTAASLVAAAAGISVAKHGNRSISSKCGSADVLETMGIPVDQPPEAAAASIRDLNFAFLFAPHYHPAMKAVAPIRRELRVRTLFNLLGPLTNPAGVRTQLVGVFRPDRAAYVAEALAKVGVERAVVVSAAAGMDEISPEGETTMVVMDGGDIAQSTVSAKDFGLEEAPLSSVLGDEPEQNARLIDAVLRGARTAARTGVLMNAAGALYAARAVENLKDGAAMAAETIDRGAVAELLDALRRPLRVAA